MYSYEIEQLLKLRSFLLTAKEYIKIIETSPQIDHIKYENDEIYIWTKDGHQFTLKIRKEK